MAHHHPGAAQSHLFSEKYDENQTLIAVQGNQTQKKTGYPTDLNTHYAIRFIEKTREKPFMLMVNCGAPDSAYSVPNTDQFKDQPGWDKNQKTYAQRVANLDTGVGRIMATLDRLGLTQNTKDKGCA